MGLGALALTCPVADNYSIPLVDLLLCTAAQQECVIWLLKDSVIDCVVKLYCCQLASWQLQDCIAGQVAFKTVLCTCCVHWRCVSAMRGQPDQYDTGALSTFAALATSVVSTPLHLGSCMDWPTGVFGPVMTTSSPCIQPLELGKFRTLRKQHQPDVDGQRCYPCATGMLRHVINSVSGQSF